MPDELLNELKKLRHPRGESSPFAGKLEFMTWVDAVLPRLAALDIPLAARFKSAVAGALSGPGTGLAEVALINEAIGILNQAVLLLETKALQGRHSIFPAATIDAPTRLTLKQRCARTPFKFYLSLCGGLLVAFLAGFWTGVFVEALPSTS